MRRILLCLATTIALAGCQVLPQGRGDGPVSRTPDRPTSTRPIAATPQGKQCLASLGATGTRFGALEDRYYGAGCSALNAVEISRIGGDRSTFEVTNLGAVTCDTASTFAAWTRYGVDRAARQILGSPLARVETMGSYSCRNVAGTGRRSAHSRAEAVDVAAFVLEDGRRIGVLGDWSDGNESEREFLRVIHRSACKRFGTVLGPDYNAAHRDHLHVEWGGRKFCR